ncbi:MAG: hypothetical protein MRZ79_03715 [Bacteroidia bacterium]|nr:hypothetical protein [Bacteroidia bacterium]
MKNFIYALLCLMLSSVGIACSPTLNLAANEVSAPRPDFSSEDERAWYSYWRGQFEQYEGSVLAPTDKYPDIARTTYQTVFNEWEKAKGTASFNNTMIYTGVGLFGTLITGLTVLLALNY